MHKHVSYFIAALASLAAKTGTPIILLFVAANTMPLREVSSVAFGFLIFNVAQIVFDFGYQVRLPKQIALGTSPRQAIFAASLGNKLSVALALCLLVLALGWIVMTPEDFLVLAYFLIAAIFSAITLHFIYVFRGELLFSREALVLVTTELLTIALVVLANSEGWTALAIAQSFCFAKFLQMLLAAWSVSDLVRPFGASFNSVEFRQSVPYAVQIMVGAGFLMLDGFLVRYFVAEEQFALQQMFVRLLILACFVLGPIQSLLVSLYSKSALEDVDKRITRARMTSIALAVASILMMSMFMLFDRAIIVGLLGEEFSVLAESSVFLSAIVVLRYISLPYGVFLSTSGDQVLRAMVLGAVLVLLLLLGSVLIPAHGIQGAFLASVIAHTVLAIAYVALSEIRRNTEPVG